MGKLSGNEINEALEALKDWQHRNNQIEKEFTFDTYMKGIDFVNRLAGKAEEQNHHPDLEVGWCKIKVAFTSHDSGGITERDVKMAKEAEAIVT
jgi:4a-hydroxytetrahydrobiopterin dehydratase|tara:strand:- start:97 stop:378 length:282 start_codon:yes stop_codon:yes gene_type:complete